MCVMNAAVERRGGSSGGIVDTGRVVRRLA
jgi:hypothetical protein